MHNLFKQHSRRKKGKNALAFSLPFHRLAFVFSAILFLLALGSAYFAYTEGQSAKLKAQQTLVEFEQLVLKKEQTIPHAIDESNPIKAQVPESIDTVTEETIILQPITTPPIESEPIAKIQIEDIGLSVSVLSEWSYELLAISVNKFSGPDPNEPGNFIVIGHNYINKAHFGSLHLVELGDLIQLTDLSGRVITYEVEEILIIKPTEVEKLATDNEIALTLITCDADSDYRFVVKSKAIIN